MIGVLIACHGGLTLSLDPIGDTRDGKLSYLIDEITLILCYRDNCNGSIRICSNDRVVLLPDS